MRGNCCGSLGRSLQNAIEFMPDVIDQPVDTTAAGDAFNARFLAAYLSGDSLEYALAKGSELSAKIICQRGALAEV